MREYEKLNLINNKKKPLSRKSGSKVVEKLKNEGNIIVCIVSSFLRIAQ